MSPLDNFICRRCGRPVDKNRAQYDTFEGMHWLCFHLEYEHGDFDPDEPCDCPGCPLGNVPPQEKNKLQRLHGANMDIDLGSADRVSWSQDQCPWNRAEGTNEHRCAVKDTSICDYFRGIEPLDFVLCAYPKG